jgi:WD40 repeat protein
LECVVATHWGVGIDHSLPSRQRQQGDGEEVDEDLEKKVHRRGFDEPDDLATANQWDRVVQLWDLESGQEVLTLHGPPAEITCLAFSNNCRRLAAGFNGGTIRIWHATPLPQEQDSK